MSAAQPLPERDPADILAEEHRYALKLLREKAMDLALRLHAKSEEPEADLGEIATRFARVARVVRQTIVLEAKFSDEDHIRRRREAAAQVAREEEERTRRFHAHTRDVMVAAEPIIAAHKRRGLDADFREHLADVRDDDDDFIDRPVEEIIAEICRELGIDPLVLPPAPPPKPRPQPVRPKPRLVEPAPPEPPAAKPAPPSAALPLNFDPEPPRPPPILESQIVNWGGPPPDTG